jgi:hypothetical protein
MIINRGRTLASGTLDDLRRLSEQMFRVDLTFANMNHGMDDRLQSLHPVELRVDGRNVEMLFRGDQSSLLEQLAELSRALPITHFEVHGADLEEIFVALVETRK